jgi:hypothetical protein
LRLIRGRFEQKGEAGKEVVQRSKGRQKLVSCVHYKLRMGFMWYGFLIVALAPLLYGAEGSKSIRYEEDLFHKDRESIYFNLEGLYWTVDEGALDYAQKMNQPTDATVFFAMGKVEKATYHLAPGLRVAAGYFNAPKYWETWAEYTWLNVHGSNTAHDPKEPNLFLTGTWPQIFSGPLMTAKSSTSVNYNTGYLMIDRVFIPNPHLRLKAVAGVGTAWIEQDWHIRYFGVADNSSVRNRWHFWGGGLRGGVFGDWFWGNNIYITGGATLGTFLGGYHNRSKQVSSTQTGAVRNSDYEDTRTAIMAQFLFGFSWQKNYCSLSRAELFVGWEITPWLNLQEVRRSSSGTNLSDAKETWLSTSLFTLQGLTTRLTLNF